MIIVMRPEVTPDSTEVQKIVKLVESFPEVRAEVRQIQGATRSLTEVYIIGSTGSLPLEPFAGAHGVERAIRIREKYRTIGRHEGQLDEVGFEYNGLFFGQDNLHVFAGLCAVDTRENVDKMFKALAAAGLETTRAGAYKPRTSPYDFQGHGKTCLPYLFELAGKHGIKCIAMEVTHENHIAELRQGLAEAGQPTGVMVQIGTRNAQNFELLKAVGQCEFPVLYKRGMGITLAESLNACEYIASAGNHRIIFCLRGMKSNLGDPHRNFIDFAHVPVVKRLARLPVCVDPSHSVGKRVRAPDGLLDLHHATAQGIVAGANMVLVDFHPAPEEALCDGPQAMLLSELPHFLADVALVRKAYEERVATARRLLKPGL